ncbi:formate/nitrite transporter family protein [Coralloluteibacterium thermophilus]|uniref:Formate/nitrite transporter family protein n=1 Tax=Coralloluteibacterium thermophilum TaxID=2707049 RepID=A0ABV9NKT4_9GAMM
MSKPDAVTVTDAGPADTARNTLEYLSGKVRRASGEVLVLALLAGAYIAFGAIAFLVTGAGGDGFAGTRVLAGGLAFSVGLILVVVAGAELFTGDTLLVVKRLRGSLDRGTMWRFWALVYAGNLVGALAVALLFVAAGGHAAGDGAVGLYALEVGQDKTTKGPGALFASGILANMLVCLAVWAAQAAGSVQGKILAIVGPIGVFVAAGLEHSVANMSILPIALLVKALAPQDFWATAGAAPADFAALTVGGALLNLGLSTLGNIVGGAAIGLAYWYAYLRGR